MRLNLSQKFLITYLIFGLSCFLGISTIASHLMFQNTLEQKAEAFYQEGLYMADQYVGNYFEENKKGIEISALQSHLSSLDVYLNAQVWLISRSGHIILNSRPSGISDDFLEIPDFSPTLPSGTYYCTGNFFNMFSEDTLSVLIPVTHNYHVQGYIAIHTPMTVVINEKEGYLLPFYITLLLLMALGLLYGAAHWIIIYRPVYRLWRSASEYALGNYESPICLTRDDEIGDLAHTMNFMAQTLKDSDEDQRKLISNVSHDFRSPLTSIKGYIEAMLDGTIPVEMQEKYLNIVLRETERLTKLTSDLLELNSMNPRQNRLDKSVFDINAVIRNTAASFEGTCTSRRITIDLLFSGWHSYVCADMGKIQQVLYNLIDNAIKFSPPDSVITIETTARFEKIFVSVRDTGSGIPKENLKKIWERFYKTDQSRGKDKKGTGLGLAIVKEIIQLHDENINVISTEGVGTEFIFSLTLANEKDAAE